MPSTNEATPNFQNPGKNLFQESIITTLGVLSASAFCLASNQTPALADTNQYQGHTVPVITSGEKWSTINYPWDGLDSSTGIYGGKNGSRTTADFTAQGDVPELGLKADTARELSGPGFVKHGTGGFFYLPSNPSVAAVKVDNEGRLCVIRRKDNKVFHALDFNDLMDKCRELNTLYASGQEPQITQKIEFNSNLVPGFIQREQDQNIDRIVAITIKYGDDNSNDRLAEQVERLTRFAKGLNNSPKQILQGFSGLYITNTAEFGSVVSERDQGAFSNPDALSPLGTIFGKEQNLQGLTQQQKYATINRFKIRFNAVLNRINQVIASNQNKPLSWRGTIAAYIALGGPVPEGVIGEGTNRGGKIAREEPRQLEERPRNNNNAEGLPCTASNFHPAIAKVTGILLAANLDQLQGTYNLKNSTDGELEARVLCGNWREKFANQLESKGGHFKQLPIEGEYKFIPPADKGGSPIFERVNFRGRTGLVDKYGNNWIPDATSDSFGRQNFHWDVQHKNGLHTNVNPDGSINHGKNGGNNFPVIPK